VKTNTLVVLGSVFAFALSMYATEANAVRWQGQSGEDPNNPAIWYSVLSVGAIRTELSTDFVATMDGWLKRHPKAKIVRVVARKPLLDSQPNSKLIFVWIVDGGENLNVYLVRHGCVAAPQMFSLSDDDMQLLRNELAMPKDKLEVSQKEYNKVKSRLIAAEKLAKTERLGIWASAKSDADRTDD
jgi:hypothetical protein